MQNNTVETQDIVFDAFRALFRAPIARVVVSHDGRTMRIGRNLSDRLAAELWLEAQRVIRENRLPLHAEVKEWKAGAVVFDRFLSIEFVDVLTESPCY